MEWFGTNMLYIIYPPTIGIKYRNKIRPFIGEIVTTMILPFKII